MAGHLLPSNSSELERLAAEAFAQIERVPVPLRELWNPDTCPVELLPILAWSFSVDRWSHSWPERAKREAIKAAYFIHAHKGTIGALRRVVEPMGYRVEVREWWQESPPGEPGTFRLFFGVNNNDISEEAYNELEYLINDARPIGRHLLNLGISLDVYGHENIGIALTDGEDLEVYPPYDRSMNVSGELIMGAFEHVIDTLEVYS